MNIQLTPKLPAYTGDAGEPRWRFITERGCPRMDYKRRPSDGAWFWADENGNTGRCTDKLSARLEAIEVPDGFDAIIT